MADGDRHEHWARRRVSAADISVLAPTIWTSEGPNIVMAVRKSRARLRIDERAQGQAGHRRGGDAQGVAGPQRAKFPLPE